MVFLWTPPPRPPACPHLMASTQLSRSSSLAALSLYDWCLPCTTRPLFSVLQALIFCPLGLYNSRQHCANKHTHSSSSSVNGARIQTVSLVNHSTDCCHKVIPQQETTINSYRKQPATGLPASCGFLMHRFSRGMIPIGSLSCGKGTDLYLAC